MTTSTAPEKHERHWTTLNQLRGHIAMWAVRQSPYPAPDGLNEVLNRFQSNARFLFDCNEMAQLSRQDIYELVGTVLLQDPQVQKWNERKNGNTAPFGFCSRHDKPSPDDDFIDLDALVMNVARTVTQENERDCGFGTTLTLIQRARALWNRITNPTPIQTHPDPTVCEQSK